MHLQGKPVCSFDPEGLIFAAGVNSEMVKLYDLRSFDKVSITLDMFLTLFTSICTLTLGGVWLSLEKMIGYAATSIMEKIMPYEENLCKRHICIR